MTFAPPLPLTSPDRVREELSRQFEILEREKWQRVALTWVALALCAFYVNPLLLFGLAVVSTACEITNQRILPALDPSRDKGRYRMTLLCVAVLEGVLALAAGLVWLSADLYAGTIAAGLIMSTALHLATVRSVHLPYGLCGLATVTVVVMMTNSLHWMPNDNWTGLAISTTAIAAGMGYALIAMLSNHDMHRKSAEGHASARAADAAKSRFLAQMSHELRTPLTAIIGLGQIEAAAAAEPASRERLGTLVASARDLAVLLDDVLDLSAITDGRVVLRPRPVDLRAELASVLATFRHQTRALHLTLDLAVDRDLPARLVLDPQRLRQCLFNLVSNAIKHVNKGGIRLSARFDGELLVLDVSDTGPGIPPALHEAVFEPFRKASAFTPGTGLGLGISRSLARQMGGDLTLLPSATGATFRLTLAAPIAGAEPAPPDLLPPDQTGRTILVVDDIATNRMVAASLLQNLSARVVEAGGGREALERLTRDRVDLVLLDMNMPDMDGVATFRAIRAMPGLVARVPVIAMTADATPTQKALITAEGLDGFLAKPLSADDLHHLLRLHLPG